MEQSPKPSFAVVGCGKVGVSLAYALSRAGYVAAGFSSRSESSAARAAGIAGGVHGTVPWNITRNADVVFITTPDGAIANVCKEIADNDGFQPNSAVLHCSGAIGSAVLEPARKCNAHTGSIHPLQSFASIYTNTNHFKEIIVAVEGDEQAVRLAGRIAGDLDAYQIEIRTEGKMLYHAAAVVASNYLVTLLDFSVQLAEKAGISGDDAIRVLKPLILGTLSNIEKNGTVKALTGPIVRGDAGTIEQHMADMEAMLPSMLPLYRMLGRYTADIAEKRETPKTDLEEVRKRFDGSES